AQRPGERALIPLTRAEAVERALSRGARVPLARADTLAAAAQLLAARALPNPALTAQYTKSIPQYHLELEIPLAYPWIRNARVGSARIAAQAARLRFGLARASAALDADTVYTLALAARDRSRLSARTAADADTLLRLAIARRDAGDASDLDVELARVYAGQQSNAAASDSAELRAMLAELQLAIGLGADSAQPFPVDSLFAPEVADAEVGEPLPLTAASAALESARLTLAAERRSAWSALSVVAGFETHDPEGTEPGILPLFGVVLPLPLLDRNRGAVALAAAERERASAELALVRLESRAGIAAARRERDVALARLARERSLVVSANRVAAMSLTAYREGASTLPNVLEAQRTAREIVAQQVDDLARAWIATATLRVLTLSPSRVP
ncbi:MAG TPA: TolC family protein, partial [Gemmatimonadaceae bacterium]|nr:TolC family protein [Gemmatimonadaceae bacterium]